MKLSTIVAAISIGSANAIFQENDLLAAKGLEKLAVHVARNGYPNPEKCTLKNVSVRREWSLFSKSEKLDYIKAVKCIAKKPARTPAAIASGAKSRYDDFVVTHIIQSLHTHGTGNFLGWHRYYIWSYEQALRNECGYKGYQPYYNWAWWAEDPSKSPVFDGSETSLSGDGTYVKRDAICVPRPDRCLTTLQPGNGGGCVTSGPMKDWKVNLGPIESRIVGLKPNPQADGLGYNPRCLGRDLNKQAARETTDKRVSFLIKNSTDIGSFQDLLQNPVNNSMGVHSGGHWTVGGDAGSDFYNSPADPYFFLHHTMIDRVWWIWQNQDLEKRTNVIAGTITFLNRPPSRDAMLNDTITLTHVGVPNITVADTVSTLGGPFCYIYV